MEGSGPTMSLLKVNEVAQRLNCSTSLVYDHIASGRLRCHRIGKGRKGIRVSDYQLETFLKRTVSAPSLLALQNQRCRSRLACGVICQVN